MPASLLNFVESTSLDAGTIARRTARIYDNILSQSDHIDQPNFTCIHTNDLEALFAHYDREFFDNRITQALKDFPLYFDLSSRMTSAGGKTIRTTEHDGNIWYELRFSTAILYGCFHDDDHRAVEVCGFRCNSRLEALQRIMEHEIVHLIEMRLWEKSSCARESFQSMTRRIFGHTEFSHRLITPKETAMVKYGIKPGMSVRFRFDGVEHTGIVNRITKRATILVEDPDGLRYSNGRNYLKFYVPVRMLVPVE